MLTKQDLTSIGSLMDDKLKPVREDIKKLRKDLDKTIDFFDKGELSTRRVLNKTRNELGMNEVIFAN